MTSEPVPGAARSSGPASAAGPGVEAGQPALRATDRVLHRQRRGPAHGGDVYGVRSMMFWSITLIVSIKYIGVPMRADDNGEGGVMASPR